MAAFVAGLVTRINRLVQKSEWRIRNFTKSSSHIGRGSELPIPVKGPKGGTPALGLKRDFQATPPVNAKPPAS